MDVGHDITYYEKEVSYHYPVLYVLREDIICTEIDLEMSDCRVVCDMSAHMLHRRSWKCYYLEFFNDDIWVGRCT